MIFSDYKEFIDQIIHKLEQLGISTSELKIDHIGYQASSKKDFDEKTAELSRRGEIIHDVNVGEKRVAIFKLSEPLEYKGQKISAVEIVSSPTRKEVDSDWEHVEIVPNGSLEEFMQKYPEIEWDTSVIDRDIFPMLVLKLDNKTRAKFPRRAVLEEVARLKKQ